MSGHWVTLLMVCIMFLECSLLVAADEGSDLLDATEIDVARIADQGIINFTQQCSLLATCDAPSNCSHDACLLQFSEREGDFHCMAVNNNKHCHLQGSTNDTCHRMNLDYSGGYVRLGQNTDIKSIDTMLAICSQRMLDRLFKNLSKPNVLSRAFFAPLDGSWRIFPGSPQNANDCRLFDPRVRPWLRTSTSVTKVVVVLIDVGPTMLNILPPDIGSGTIFQAAKNMTKQLFTTISETDYMNIIVFDSSRAEPLSPAAVLVHRNGSGSDEDPGLEGLKAKLDQQTIEGSSKQSNISNAILTALPMFEAANSQAARVIIVLTDGVFATLGNVTLPTAELSSKKVKIFLYKLKPSNDNDVFLEKTTLPQQLCDVGGHFEPILKNVNNGLLAFAKYFSYLANLRRVITGGKPQYSYVYRDFEQIGGNIITISKSAFYQGELIGVAGITIYIDLLGPLTDAVNVALGNRVTGYSVNLDVNGYVNLTCSVTNETLQPCGSDPKIMPANGGLCPKTDAPVHTITDVVCCDTCKAPPPPPVKRIVATTVGSVASLIMLIIGVFFIKRWCDVREQKKKKNLEFLHFQRPPDE